VVETRTKDPERVRLGRLGALTTHARGHTNTGPARAAWEARLAAEHGIDKAEDPSERVRRMDAALRLRMTRLAMQRWGSRKPEVVGQTPTSGTDHDDADVDGPDAS
jgi:hypothetical protein